MLAPEVSVIMAAYNGEHYIEESIRSVLAQSYAALELIVIDDGSTDGTWEIVNALQADDERIVYAFQPNGRQGKARNNGIRRARGSLIAFCDQDDLWVKEKLARQLDALAAADGASVVFSDGFLFYDDDIADERTTFKTLTGVHDGPQMFRLLFSENRIPVLSSLVRKEAIVRVGMLSEDPLRQNCDDWDLWLRLAQSGCRFLGLPDRLVRYRLHSRQASRDPNVMGKAEIAVLEQFRRSTLLGRDVAERDLERRYQKLIDGLLRANLHQEAAVWAGRWLRAQKAWSPLWRAAMCRFYPGGFEKIQSAEQRVSWLLEDPIVHGRDFLRRAFGRA